MPGVVSVGCKLPGGLQIQLFNMEKRTELVMGGGVREVDIATPASARVKLNGFARYLGADSEHAIISGTGITHGVDADFFAEWLKRNKDMDVVKKGLVFAQAKAGEVEAQARDHKSLKSGLEAIDPGNLPLEFKGKIQTADVKA